VLATPPAVAATSNDGAAVVTFKSGRSYRVYGDLLVPLDAPPGMQGALSGTRWPSATLNYIFDASVGSAQRAQFRTWGQDWEAGSGVRLVENAAAANRVRVQRGSVIGCGQSVLGMVGGEQDLVISTNSNCWTRSVLAHELGHALSAIHEQQRTDRNNYVSIVDHGIVAQCGQGTWDANYGTVATQVATAYDYASVMHYPASAHYTCNGIDVWADITVLQAQPPGLPAGSGNACTSVATCQGTIGSGLVSARDLYGMALRYGYRYQVTVTGNGGGFYTASGQVESCGSDCYLVPPTNGTSTFRVNAFPASGSIASFAGACVGHSCVIAPNRNGNITLRFTRKTSVAAVTTAAGWRGGDMIFASGFEVPQ